MNSGQNQEETLFDAARNLANSAERAEFLNAACKHNPELRRRVEALLAAQSRADAYFRPGVQDPGLGLTRRDMKSAAPSQCATLENLGDRIDRYKLLEKIGEGGCGVVYVAEQEEPVRRRVALKVIKLGMDTRQFVARFQAERQALAMMDHPSIAKVLDAGATETGRPYFVMELVRGIRITDFCDDNKLPTRRRLDLFIPVCHAVQHAHQKGIIHRDIKPSNILVTLHDGVPVPKVIDFGIAKATEGRLTEATLYTQLHQFIGTPAYMSPEQAGMSGLDIDTRSDIYSLGVLLYELLTGRTPFDPKELLEAGPDEMRRTLREVEPPRPSTRMSTLAHGDLTTTAKSHASEPHKLIVLLRGDLDWIVMKAMEKDRTRRYETANGLAMDIQRHLNNEPVLARPPSAVYRFRKLVRRNKLAFASAGAVTAALVIGLVVSIRSYLRETEARDREAEQKRSAVEARADAEEAAKGAELGRYIALMNQTQHDWGQNNLARVRESLEETRAFGGRSFEWEYWQAEMHREVRTFRGHLDRVGHVAVSRNGRCIATASNDGTVVVWDLSTGRELLTYSEHEDWVRCVAFLPDNERIASCGDDGAIRVWEARTGRDLWDVQAAGEVYDLAISLDPVHIVTGHGAGTVQVWDGETGKLLRTLKDLEAPGNDGVWGVAISTNAQRVIAGSAYRGMAVWDFRQGEAPIYRLAHNPQPENSRVWSVAFSPDEKAFVSAGWDGTIKLWNVATGELLQPIVVSIRWVFDADFSPGGEEIVTGSEDGVVRVWSVQTGGLLQEFKGHRGPANSVSFAPDGRTLVTSGAEPDNTAKVWRLATPPRPLVLKHEETSTGGQILSRVISSAGPASMSLRAPGVWSIAFSPDSLRLAVAGGNGTASIWNVTTGFLERKLTGHSAVISSISFSEDGMMLVTGSYDGTVRIWDATIEREPLVIKAHEDAITSVAVSPDGKWLATASCDRTVRLWELSAMKSGPSLAPHRGPVHSVVFSSGSDWVLTAESIHAVPRQWRPTTGWEGLQFTLAKPEFTFGGKATFSGIFCLAISPDDQLIVGGQWSNVRLWDATTGKHLLDLRGHTRPVASVAFSPDSRRLISGGLDNLVKVFETTTGREVLTLRGHTREVTSVAFSPNGRHVASGSMDGTVRVWTAAAPEQLAAWQQEEDAAEQRLEALTRERLLRQTR